MSYGREAAPIRSVIRYSPVASRPGLSSASMFVPIRYWETRSRLVPSRGPLAAPAPHGGFLRPWFLGFEAPHPPPAAVVDSAWVPRRRETPVVLLLCCWICGVPLLGFVVRKKSVSLQPKNQNIAAPVLFRKFYFFGQGFGSVFSQQARSPTQSQAIVLIVVTPCARASGRDTYSSTCISAATSRFLNKHSLVQFLSFVR